MKRKTAAAAALATAAAAIAGAATAPAAPVRAASVVTCNAKVHPTDPSSRRPHGT